MLKLQRALYKVSEAQHCTGTDNTEYTKARILVSEVRVKYKFPLTIPYPITPVGVVAGKAITEGA